MAEPATHGLSDTAAAVRPRSLRATAAQWADWVLSEALKSGRLLAIGLTLALTLLWVRDSDWLRTARFAVFDLFQQIAPRALATDRVAIVDIDEASLRELGQWPWSRATLRDMVDNLLAAGALSVGFDVVFAEPDRLSPPSLAETLDLPADGRALMRGLPDTDRLFASALDGAPVVLGMSGSTEVPSEAAIASPIGSRVVEIGGDPRPFLFGFPSLLRNIETLDRAASGHGMFTLTPEHDGVVRRIPAVLRVAGQIYPSLGLEALRLASRAENVGVVRNGAGTGIESVRLRNVEVPTDVNGLIWLRFSPHQPQLYLPAKDIVTGRFDPAAVRDKLILVGPSAVGLRDLRMTPLGETVPGVELHAQLIDSILAGDYLQRPGHAGMLELMAAMLGCLLLVGVVPRLSALQSLPVFVSLVAGYWGGAYLIYDRLSYAFDPTFPTGVAVLAFAALIYGSYSKVEAQRRQIRSAFQHYLSPDLVGQLVDNPRSLSLGGENREMTFLFSDIAGFTSFTERSDPQVLVRLLNEYLDGVCKIVMEHGGTIDKIVGDAVHAFFNAPLDQPDHAERAVDCALAMDAFARAFTEDKAREGHDFGETRIGVNTGHAIVGNFGGSNRFDFTAHGDAINTAARLEGANKYLGTRICVAGSTAALCAGKRFRPIGSLLLKGKEEPVRTFEPLRDPTPMNVPEQDYAGAFGLLEGGDPAARSRFAELAERFPLDPLVALHSRRLAEGATGAAIVLGDK